MKYNSMTDHIIDSTKQQRYIRCSGDEWTAGAWRWSTTGLLHLLPRYSHLVTTCLITCQSSCSASTHH